MTPETDFAEAAGGWQTLLRSGRLGPLAVMLGGILLHSMNVLLVATVLPSIVAEVGGAALLSWPTTAFLASSIVAATCAGLLTALAGPGRAFCLGAALFCAGSLLCALSPSMTAFIAGRLVQGFGGGLLSAVSYVLVRRVFPEAAWPRVFALLAGIWSVSVLFGPLLGGLFAQAGDWRGAFWAVAGLAGLLAVLGLRAFPVSPERPPGGPESRPPLPLARLALVICAIAALSVAAIAASAGLRAGLIVLAVGGLAVLLQRDRQSANPLLPRAAFSLRDAGGTGLWLALLLSISFAPLSIYGPALLQRLHGLAPLPAGYMVAGGSMAWTVLAVAVSGLAAARWSGRLSVAGPLAMAAGLAGLAHVLPGGALPAVQAAIVIMGAGIGCCWAFVAQGVMSAAPREEADIAASSVATVQQTGLALGAALAGLVANLSGFATGGDAEAAFWVPAWFVLAALAAGAAGLWQGRLARRARPVAA